MKRTQYIDKNITKIVLFAEKNYSIRQANTNGFRLLVIPMHRLSISA